MKKINWNKETYQQFVEYLYTLQDLKYRDFHSGLGINKEYLIGIRMPQLKKIAKDISMGDYKSFIKYNTHATYEERMIHGLIIGYIKEEFSSIQTLLIDFIPYIDNWALCDCVCGNLKIWNKNTNNGLNFIKKTLKSQNNWYKRVGVVLLLNYYINDKYIDTIISIFQDYNSDDYYVMMAIAWLLSMCYVNYPDKIIQLLSSKKLDKIIQNKTIQKIKESRRVTREEKEQLNKWRL